MRERLPTPLDAGYPLERLHFLGKGAHLASLAILSVLSTLACSASTSPSSAAAGGSGDGGSIGGAADGTAPACNMVAQTGCGPGEKCTLVESPTGNLRGCVALTGDVAEGHACRRADEGFGHDDCSAGSTCTFIGVVPPSAGGTRRCRVLCEEDTDCGTGERCAALTRETDGGGFCGPVCTPFGNDCPTPLECTRVWPGSRATPPASDFFVTCRAPGARPAGATCDPVAEDCATGLVCATLGGGAGVCLMPCDANHPCAAGDCTLLDGTLGLCLDAT